MVKKKVFEEEIMPEFNLKKKAVEDLLQKYCLDGLLLQRSSSFAWATCGAASYINRASSFGEAKLLYLQDKWYLITNNIEITRLEKEEKLYKQDWDFVVTPWYEGGDRVAKLCKGLKVGTDATSENYLDISDDFARIRANLTPQEGDRFRVLGRICGEAMSDAARKVHPGQTEFEIAGLISAETEKRGVQVVVNLVATDERIFNFRHPLPTDKKLEQYAMLILCGRKDGLICSITRFVHFGSLSNEIREKAVALAEVDAEFITATRPGRSLRDVFQQGIDAYKRVGYPEEWKLHHQGGPAGYEPREFVATLDVQDLVTIGQVYAWNPSITGTKSEDTILIGQYENEVLTEIEDWPTIDVDIRGNKYSRPAILEIG